MKEKVSERSPKKKKWYTVLLIIFISLIVLCLLAVIFVKVAFPYNYNEITEMPEELGYEEVRDERIINLALFGLDTRSPEAFSGRSDTIMILSVNTKTKEIKLMSVMRDSLVPIEKNGRTTFGKINGAYASGGPELAIKTLNTIFNLDISEYVSVNFFKLADIIDAIGGIEVTLTEAEIKYVNEGVSDICHRLDMEDDDYMVTSAGTQHLNGIQASSYARIRYVANAEGTANDYGRTDRQRYVMGQMLNKVKTMSKFEYTKLIKPILASCETSLTYGEVFDVAVKMLSSNPTFEETRVPEQSFLMPSPSSRFGSIVYYDLNFAAKLIHAFIYDDIPPETFVQTNGIEKNNWYVNGFTPPKIEHGKDLNQSSAVSSSESSSESETVSE